MGGLVCPHCGASTALAPVSITGKGILVDQCSDNHIKYGKVSIPALVESSPGWPYLAIVACQAAGCGERFVAEKDWVGNWMAAWPPPATSVPEEIPDPVRTAFREALLCVAVGAPGGCLLMCRTALIRMQRERKVANLQELQESGAISRSLREQADEVRLWANVVGHEDFSEEALTREACEELVEYVRSLLDALYVQPARLARRRECRKKATSGGAE